VLIDHFVFLVFCLLFFWFGGLVLEGVLFWVLLWFTVMVAVDKKGFVGLYGKAYYNRNGTVYVMFYGCA